MPSGHPPNSANGSNYWVSQFMLLDERALRVVEIVLLPALVPSLRNTLNVLELVASVPVSAAESLPASSVVPAPTASSVVAEVARFWVSVTTSEPADSAKPPAHHRSR